MTTAISRLLAVMLVSGLLGAGLSTPARADEEPPPTTVTVTGTMPSSETFEATDVHVCSDTGCESDNEVEEKDGQFVISGVTVGGGYTLAVHYKTFVYRGQRKVRTTGEGRLQASGDVYKVVDRVEDATEFTIDESGDLGTLVVDVPVPEAPPEPPPPYPSARVRLVLGSYIGDTAYFDYKASRVEKGTVIKVQVLGCGNRVVGRYLNRKKTGKFSFTVEFPSSQLRRYTPFKIAVSQPGFRTSRSSGRLGPFEAAKRSC